MPVSSPEVPPVRRREIFGWAMFDFANSSYTTVIVTFLFSVFFVEAIAPEGRGEFLWGLAISISNAIVMVLATVLGAAADGAGRKKAFLFATYSLCVLGTAGLFFAAPGQLALAMTLFILSNVAFALGENFTGAFLPEITTPKTIGRISGLGWGIGYVGGLLALFACLPFAKTGLAAVNFPTLRWAWVVTALFFALAGLPTFLLLRERAPKRSLSLAHHAAESLRRLKETVREVRHFRQLARFLIVFAIFQAGLTSVIAFTAVYASSTLGFSTGQLFLLSIFVNLSAAAGAVGFGRLQDKIGAKLTIQISLLMWIGVTVLAYLSQTAGQFTATATIAGLGIGSLQSASRSLVGLFSPASKSAELFGFWGLAAKGGYMVGPVVFGLIASGTGSQRIALLAVSAFFIAGLFGMSRIDEAAGIEAAQEWDEREARRLSTA